MVPSGFQSPTTESLGGKHGGTLVVLNETDFEHLDPGIAYFSVDYAVVFATQRPLYSNKPNTATEATPDMAEGPPEISSDNKTVTVKLKEGIHFSPPVNSEVTSEDVAYAIERGANPNVANPYIQSYFASIEGMPKATGGPIPGITTPDKHTIVFKLTEPKGQLVADALVLPLTAAVPKAYAEKFDKHKPTDYANYQVATGPYMLKNNAEGKVLGIGYIPGKSATLVRNPNWKASTDFRPAYLNEIQIKIGGTDSVIGRQVLEGKSSVENDSQVAQSIIRLAAEKYKTQLQISPGAGSHYIGVNNKVGVFSNIDLRKAFWAALNRSAMVKARGGSLVTDVMTHFIYPTIPGFEQAGGLKGPQVDYNMYPEGNKAVSEKYIKLAGYPSGKYTGSQVVDIVGARGNPDEQDAEIVNQTLKNMGFTTKFTLVEASTMYAKYCNVPKEEITVCPNVGWIADFADPQTVLNITFNGTTITPDRQRQLGPDECAENQRGDESCRIGRRPVGASYRVGEDRHRTRRRRRRDPVRLGQAGQHREQQRRRRRPALEHRHVGLQLDIAEVGDALRAAVWGSAAAGPPDRDRRKRRQPAGHAQVDTDTELAMTTTNTGRQ